MFAVRNFMQTMTKEEFGWYLEQFPDVLRKTLKPTPSDSAFVIRGEILRSMYVVFAYDSLFFVGKSKEGLDRKDVALVLDKYSKYLEKYLFVETTKGNVFLEVCCQYEELLKERGVLPRLARKTAPAVVTELINEVYSHSILNFRNGKHRCNGLPQ